jgi:hemerythrin-like domain-containing protein
MRIAFAGWHGTCKGFTIGDRPSTSFINALPEIRMATKQSSRKSSSRKSAARKTRSGSSAASGSNRSAARKTSGRSGSDGKRSASGARKSASRGTRGVAKSSRAAKSPSSSRSARGGAADALKLLKQDHDNVDAMFKKYDRMKDGDERKAALREQICAELTVHATVEEELFYPSLKTLFEEGGKDKAVDLIEEADVEHASLKWLIEQLQSGDQSDEGMVDARVKVLSEYVKHHVEEEEGEIFKAARKVDLDLVELGARIEARKGELKAGGASQEDDQRRGTRSGRGSRTDMLEPAEAGTER